MRVYYGFVWNYGFNKRDFKIVFLRIAFFKSQRHLGKTSLKVFFFFFLTCPHNDRRTRDLNL